MTVEKKVAKSTRLLRLLFVGILVIWLPLFVPLGCAKKTPPPKPYTPPAKPHTPSQPVEKKTKPYKVLGKWYQPVSDSQGFVERGLASWYGKKFHGRKTANGETYDMYGVTAAHKTLPLGTFVRVHNLDNNRRLDVRINDRGPFVRGRVIDLSYGAAKKLGVVGPGTARVKFVALGTPAKQAKKSATPTYIPADYTKGNFTFQVGAFKDYGNALRLSRTLNAKYKNAHITNFDSGDGIFYRVRVGRFSTLGQAQKQRGALRADGFEDPFVVAE